MELITEFLSTPEALFAGKLMLAFTLFLCSYSIVEKITSKMFRSNQLVHHGLGIVISLYAFQIAFPPSGGPGFFPSMWEVTGLFSVVVLLISLCMIKYMSGVGLMIHQFTKRKKWIAWLIGVSLIFVFFLPVVVQLFSSQLGEFYSLAFNLTWLLNLCLTIIGAVNSVFRGFRKIIEEFIGKGNLTKSIVVAFVMLSIIVIPQMIPYSSILTKFTSTLGIITAVKYVRM